MLQPINVQAVPHQLTSSGSRCCQRSTCGITLIFHRPAWTDGLHNIVSTHSPPGHLCYYFLIQLISWIFMILSDGVMRAKAKVPLSICGWMRLKLSSSPSFITGYFWAHDWGGNTRSFARWTREIWYNVSVWVSSSLIPHCLSAQLAEQQLTLNLEAEEKGARKVMDSSINQLVTRRLLTRPHRQGATGLPLLLQSTPSSLCLQPHILIWSSDCFSACFGWQPHGE